MAQKIEERKVHHLKVIYKTPDDKIVTSVIPFNDMYEEEISYRENMEKVVFAALDEGGVWVDSETIVPFHRICYFKEYKEPVEKFESKPKQRRNNRRSSRGRNISAKNPPSSNQDS